MEISLALDNWLQSVRAARKYKTYETYGCAATALKQSLIGHKVPLSSGTETIDERVFAWMAEDLKHQSPYTERLYLTAIKQFFIYLVTEHLSDVNTERITGVIRQRARRPGKRIPQFYGDEIDKVIEYMVNLNLSSEPGERLRDLRDRALIITLPDTGLRIHEALNLTRGDIDWKNGQAIIIGKDDQQAVIRFTKRSMDAMKLYLRARGEMDGATGRQGTALPIFSRHDPGTGKRVQKLTTETGRQIVYDRVKEAVGEDAAKNITPHSFRHYFVTKVLLVTQNLKLAQDLARHRNIQNTQLYTHLVNEDLDRGYREVFENG